MIQFIIVSILIGVVAVPTLIIYDVWSGAMWADFMGMPWWGQLFMAFYAFIMVFGQLGAFDTEEDEL